MAGDPFNRTFKRPLKVQSNTGYYITITYQYTGTDVTQPGWGTPAEAALYDPSGTLIRRIDYSGTAITDYGNNIANTGGRTFTTTIANALGGDLEQNNVTVQLPTEATNQLTITPTLLNGLNLITNVTRDGVGWTYSYVNPQNYLACSPSTFVQRYDSVTVSGPNGYSVRYDMFPPNSFSCPADPYIIWSRAAPTRWGSASYSYDFSSGDRLVGITLPEGNSVSLIYNECSNIVTKTMVAKPGSGLANIVESAVYPSNGIPEDPCPDVTYFRPTSTTDARGHTTNYAWNSTTGQLTQELAPADANNVRRQTDITYATNAAGLSLKTLVRVCGQTTTCSGNAESHTEYTYFGNTSSAAHRHAKRRGDRRHRSHDLHLRCCGSRAFRAGAAERRQWYEVFPLRSLWPQVLGDWRGRLPVMSGSPSNTPTATPTTNSRRSKPGPQAALGRIASMFPR